MALKSVNTQTKGKLDTATTGPAGKPQYLGRLAAELHISIAQNLEKKDLRSLRRLSRSLAKDTFDIFAEKNFTCLSCRFTTRSLKNARKISATPHFVRHVKTIAFYAEPGHKTELPWPRIVPKVGEGRAPAANDILLKHIFCNVAKCGLAKGIRLNTTDGFFNPALHAVAIAIGASGLVVEELHCSIDDRPTPIFGASAGGYSGFVDNPVPTAFSHVAKLSLSNLRTIQAIYPAPGGSGQYVRPTLCLLIEAACSVQELTLQMPFGHFWEKFRHTLTDRHNLRVLKLHGNKEECDFSGWELSMILSQVSHSLETLMLENIKIYTALDGHWKDLLDWLSKALSLTYISCKNLRTTISPFVSSSLLLDGKGNSEFVVEGSEEEFKERLATVVAEVGYRVELEVKSSERPDEEASL